MDAERTTSRRARRSAALACGVVLSLAACDSAGTPTSAGTPAPSPTVASAALCADAAAVRASTDALRNVTVAAGMADEIKADLNRVAADLTTLATDARGQWKAQTDALTSALAAFRTALANLAASPAAGAVSAVASARGQVNAAAQDLLAVVTVSCPSPSG